MSLHLSLCPPYIYVLPYLVLLGPAGLLWGVPWDDWGHWLLDQDSPYKEEGNNKGCSKHPRLWWSLNLVLMYTHSLHL